MTMLINSEDEYQKNKIKLIKLFNDSKIPENLLKIKAFFKENKEDSKENYNSLKREYRHKLLKEKLHNKLSGIGMTYDRENPYIILTEFISKNRRNPDLKEFKERIKTNFNK